MPAKTCALSDICGTHFGEPKAVASTAGRPASASLSISSIFTAVGTPVASFCRPSRGATSTILTLRGRLIWAPGWEGADCARQAQERVLFFPLRARGLLRRLEPGGRALFQERAHALL